ncbi:hypothetical protein GYMLUDRAFT_236593 [Collybiopsis luxurians FD-317 M1]|nr:hypothetical protein GYMLUDRAFT_236593 [Collybiopsis luxurians FD-317 M1]
MSLRLFVLDRHRPVDKRDHWMTYPLFNQYSSSWTQKCRQKARQLDTAEAEIHQSGKYVNAAVAAPNELLDEKGKVEDLKSCLNSYFDSHPELKADPRYTVLFPKKRGRPITDLHVNTNAWPSTPSLPVLLNDVACHHHHHLSHQAPE